MPIILRKSHQTFIQSQVEKNILIILIFIIRLYLTANSELFQDQVYDKAAESFQLDQPHPIQIMPHPNLFEDFDRRIVYPHLLLQPTGVIPVQDNRYEHVGHEEDTHDYEGDEVHVAGLAAAVLDAVLLDLRILLLLFLALE